jgi:hypothetical protein
MQSAKVQSSNNVQRRIAVGNIKSEIPCGKDLFIATSSNFPGGGLHWG